MGKQNGVKCRRDDGIELGALLVAVGSLEYINEPVFIGPAAAAAAVDSGERMRSFASELVDWKTKPSHGTYDGARDMEATYLNTRFAQVRVFRQVLSGLNIRIMRAMEDVLELFDLILSEARSVPAALACRIGVSYVFKSLLVKRPT